MGAQGARDGKPGPGTRNEEEPYARPAEPLAQDQKPDQLAEEESRAENHQEALLDEAVEETFPGSDPISPNHVR